MTTLHTTLEPTRTRENGTKNTRTNGDAVVKMAAIRQIVASHQYAKIDGLMVDGFSASAIVQVFDALNPENQARYAALTIPKMAAVAFKLCK